MLLVVSRRIVCSKTGENVARMRPYLAVYLYFQMQKVLKDVFSAELPAWRGELNPGKYK